MGWTACQHYLQPSSSEKRSIQNGNNLLPLQNLLILLVANESLIKLSEYTGWSETLQIKPLFSHYASPVLIMTLGF